MQVTEREAIRRYNKEHNVGWLTQLIYGSKTVLNGNIKPCPTCHGNDMVNTIREAPGFVLAACDRCSTEYLG